MKRYKTETGIFIYFLFVRISFIILSGFNTCELCSDSGWIDMLSERVLAGNFDFDIGRFIVAPFYNIFIAIHKIIFQRYWTVALISSQLILSSLSGVCLYKIGSMLFERRTALVSTAIFCVFPMTLWWVHTFCTESIFQSLLIISLFFLLKTVYTARYLYLILSAIIFSITFLTKAHILLYSPFLALYLFMNLYGYKKVFFPFVYTSICLLATLPFGIYNLKLHNQYIISSNGSAFHFYTGNSNFGYITVVDVPEKGTEEFQKMKDMDMSFFNGEIHDKIMIKKHYIKQKEYLIYSVNWIANNPVSFLKLKLYNAFFFIFPGVSFRHYNLRLWAFSFFVSAPFYILGYIGMIFWIKKDFKHHFFSFGIFITMFIFSVVWYTQNRFRTITIEPIYILYAGNTLFRMTKKLKGIIY
ncbi:MAG: hypothetical protein D3918_10035 [Candidatus Electrothrix sp. AX2]|nr:hypothetical protein [Candidatus Electrothrix gigas]